MKITDHGEWVLYEPKVRPHAVRYVKQKIIFCQRVSDSVDWYEYQHEVKNDNIWMTVDKERTVQATARDVSMLFPADLKVLEVQDDVDHESFRQKIFDGTKFLPARPRSINRVEFLTALHNAGQLQKWKDYVANISDVPLQIELEHSMMFRLDDPKLQAAARDLGWNAQTMRRMFDNPKEL